MNIMWALLQSIFGRSKPNKVAVVEERVPYSNNPLKGLPLRYLIGSDGPWAAKDGAIIELPYGAPMNVVGKPGKWIFYVNLFDETNSGDYGPYLHNSDTAAQYGEGQINPNGSGWAKNLINQFKKIQAAGGLYVELDNPDAYDTSAVNGAVSMAANYGLRVLAKNPGICEPDPVSYVKHNNVYGIIVEKGAGTPAEMEALRKKAARPDLPVWFVFFGGTRSVAQETARLIKANEYKWMGVTISPKSEYGESIDVLLPLQG